MEREITWEYATFGLYGNTLQIIKKLNELGKDGWEFINKESYDSYTELWMKRKIERRDENG